MKNYFSLLLCLLLPLLASSQSINQDELNRLSAKYAISSFPLLNEFLSIPNDASYPVDIEKNVVFCEEEFKLRGFTTTRIETAVSPLLLAERKVKRAKKTVLVYLQIDGQPVDTSQWFQENPYKPALKNKTKEGEWEEISWDLIENYDDEWRIFARSTADSKGAATMFLAALDAIAEKKVVPNYNLKVIMDFEEELGSPRLPKAVTDNTELLKSDMLIIFDGPRHITNKPTLSFGARGIATFTLTTYGPIVPQHSGHYGNYAPNPALGLAKLLASMKDDEGRVIIPGFYDGISISPEVEKILRAVPDDEKQIQDRLQIGSVDKVGSYYQESIQYPSLNIRGMESGWIDKEVRTIIPGWARAEVDVRLVPEVDPERLISLIKNYIEAEGYYLLEDVPNKEERMSHEKVATFNYEVSYQAFRTDFDAEVGLWLRKAIVKAFGEEPIMIRMSGGSIPISPFVVTLGIPAVTVPTVNRDNNQHSPNENIRLGNYRDGIKTMIAILTEAL